jgi:hypothetical protein
LRLLKHRRAVLHCGGDVSQEDVPALASHTAPSTRFPADMHLTEV